MGNIVRDYIKEFLLNNMNLHISEKLSEIENYALEHNVPIIDKEVQNLISMLFNIKRPKKILEFGTAIGFSALFMYEQLGGDVFITTMERDVNRICIAKENFKLFNCNEKIELIEGDCFENIRCLHNQYDFIFIDSSKSHYEKLFNMCIQNLTEDGIIVFDNILYKGMIASDSLVEKRKKTIIKNMRNFIQNVIKNENFSTLLLPIGDGVMILRRKN